MNKIFFFCLINFIYYTSPYAQENGKYLHLLTEVRNEEEINYNKNCQNNLCYDKTTDSICRDGFYFIYGRMKNTHLILYESRGIIINGKKDKIWALIYLQPDSNNNTIRKYEYYENGLLQARNVDLNYKETDSLLKTLYQTNFKNGTGYYKDYNHNGIVTAEGNYKEGCKNGWWKYYNDKGVLIRKEKYNKGGLIKTHT